MSISLADYAKAKAFTLWVKSIIGKEPEIINVNEQYLEIDFKPDEIEAFKSYLDRQVGGLLVPKPTDQTPPTVQIRFGKILVPWSIQYLLPAIAGVFGLGYLTGNLINKK